MSYISRDTKLDYSGDDTVVFEYEWTLDTNAFADGDVMSALIEIPNAVAAVGGTGAIKKVSLLHKAGSGAAQSPNIHVLFFKKSFTPAAINAAMTYAGELSDIDSVHVAGTNSWVDITSAVNICEIAWVGHQFQAADDQTSLWAIAICREAVTYTANCKLLLRVAITRD